MCTSSIRERQLIRAALPVCVCVLSAALALCTVGCSGKTPVSDERSGQSASPASSDSRQPAGSEKPTRPPASDDRPGNTAAEASARPSPLARGVAWLMAQQAGDGGWHSEETGALRSGAATTAFAVYAVSFAPQELRSRHRKQLQAGFDFLRKGIARKGYVVAPDGTADYPTYASAMTLLASRRLGFGLADEEADKLAAFLAEAQLDEQEDFTPDNPHYGGWDFMGGTGVKGATSGTNVSVSSFALEALAASKNGDFQEVLARGGRWAGRCQNFPGDGGFVFHPEPEHLGNKAGLVEETMRPRSYGTTTADGLACLLFSGAAADDERVRAAVDWLARHEKVHVVPGFENASDYARGWAEALKFYYAFVLSRVLPALPQDAAGKRRAALARFLAAEQRDDGSWRNKSALMRENDPLLATCLAVTALARAHSAKDRPDD